MNDNFRFNVDVISDTFLYFICFYFSDVLLNFYSKNIQSRHTSFLTIQLKQAVMYRANSPKVTVSDE